MSVVNKLRTNFLRVATFFDVQSCIAFQGTCRAGRAFFAGDDTWQKEVVAVLKGIEGQFTPLEPETRALLRQRMVFYPADIQFVQASVKQIRAVCDEMRKEGLKAQDAAVVLRHAVTMTTPYCHLPVHPVLASLEGGLQGKGKVEVLFINQIAVLTRDNERVAKLMREDGGKTWPEARSYETERLKKIRAAYEMMAALGSKSVAPTHALRDGTVAQQYIPRSMVLLELFQCPELAETVRSLISTEAQLHMLMDLVRGKLDAHSGNTVVTTDEGGESHLVDIDEELNFPWLNAGVQGGLEESTPNAAVLGLPQGGQPIPKAVLRLLSYPGWKEKCVQILELHGLSGSISAFAQRCDKIRAICKVELAREKPLITPRDFYFALFGKDCLYELASIHKIPPLHFFESIVSKDEGRWKSIEFCHPIGDFAKNCQALEQAPPPPVFSLQPKTRTQVDDILAQIAKTLYGDEKILCVEVQPGAFDGAGWIYYQKENPQDSVAIKSFMLSHFLQGAAKRVARMINTVHPHFSLNVVRDNEGKLWLEVSHHPLFKEVLQKWEKNRGQNSLDLMKLQPNQIDFIEKKKFKPYHNVNNCLIGEELKFLVTKMDQAFSDDGYLDIEQKPDGSYFLVFRRHKN